jgi:pimeloyl-ACP methyl ester carboxylesterase
MRVRILGAGPRLVLLHGGPGLDHHVLLPLAEQLADVYELWLPDLPGHGAHERGRRPPSLADTLQRLERWLGSLGGAVDVLAGHSLGAWIVRELLRRGRVARPRAAVLIAPPAGDRERPRLDWPRIRRGRRLAPDEARRALLAEVQAETGQAPSARFAAAVAQAALRHPTEHGPLLKALSLALSQPTPRCRPGCPTLVVSGEADPVVTPHQAARVASATSGAELVTVPGVGHLPAATGTDAVAAHVRAFLAAHLRR